MRDVILLVDCNFRLRAETNSQRSLVEPKDVNDRDDEQEQRSIAGEGGDEIRWTAKDYVIGITRKYLVIAEKDIQSKIVNFGENKNQNNSGHEGLKVGEKEEEGNSGRERKVSDRPNTRH